MTLTQDQQKLANAYAKRHMNRALYERGVIPKELFDAAHERLLCEIDRLDRLCYQQSRGMLNMAEF